MSPCFGGAGQIAGRLASERGSWALGSGGHMRVREAMAMTQLPKSQETLLLVFAEEALTIVWSTDRTGKVDRLSGGVLATLGMELPDLPAGVLVEELFEDSPSAESGLAEAHEAALGGHVTRCEFDWNGWHFRGKVMPQLSDCGEVTGCLGLARLDAVIDRLEEALEASERRFETLVGLSPAGIYMTDAAGRCMYVNQRWCEMAGVTAVQSLGRSWELVIHPEDRGHISQQWREMIARNGVWEHEYRVLSPQGKTVWVFGQAKPLRDVHGRITGYVGINVDVTAQKKRTGSCVPARNVSHGSCPR